MVHGYKPRWTIYWEPILQVSPSTNARQFDQEARPGLWRFSHCSSWEKHHDAVMRDMVSPKFSTKVEQFEENAVLSGMFFKGNNEIQSCGRNNQSFNHVIFHTFPLRKEIPSPLHKSIITIAKGNTHEWLHQVAGCCCVWQSYKNTAASTFFWLVVSTHLKDISQNGNLPQLGVKIENLRHHHLVFGMYMLLAMWNSRLGGNSKKHVRFYRLSEAESHPMKFMI